MERNKRGEGQYGWIIAVIVILLTAGILFYSLYKINFVSKIDSEACHQSVIFRGTLPSISEAQNYIPLKCKTEKVCLSGKSGAKCSDFQQAKGVTTVKATSSDQIQKTIAGKIIDCWSVMGKGEVSLYSKSIPQIYGLGKIYSSCVICSRIALNKKELEKSGLHLENLDLQKYMLTHAVPNKGVSYIEYLTGSKNSAPISITEKIKIPADKESDSPELEIDLTNPDLTYDQVVEGTINSERNQDANSEDPEIAVLFMQISAPTVSGVLTADLASVFGFGAAASGAFVISPKFIQRPIGKLVSNVVKAAVRHPVIATLIVASGAVVQGVGIYKNQAIAAMKCGDVSTGDNAREGCSVVRTVNYNEEEIKSYCGVIESIA